MAMVGLRVPSEVGRLLSGLNFKGQPVDPATYHVTLLDLGDNVAIEQLCRAVTAVYGVVQKTTPFTLTMDRISSFPASAEGNVPVICPVSSKPLSVLRDRLVEAFTEEDISFSREFPVFRGHITLAYLHGKAPAPQAFEAFSWGVSEVVLWGGDDGDERMTATFPFKPRLQKTAFYRAFVRLSTLSPHNIFDAYKGVV